MASRSRPKEGRDAGSMVRGSDIQLKAKRGKNLESRCPFSHEYAILRIDSTGSPYVPKLLKRRYLATVSHRKELLITVVLLLGAEYGVPYRVHSMK